MPSITNEVSFIIKRHPIHLFPHLEQPKRAKHKHKFYLKLTVAPFYIYNISCDKPCYRVGTSQLWHSYVMVGTSQPLLGWDTFWKRLTNVTDGTSHMWRDRTSHYWLSQYIGPKEFSIDVNISCQFLLESLIIIICPYL